MISLENVYFRYHRIRAGRQVGAPVAARAARDPQGWILWNLSREFDGSGITSIVGESGVGKSTLISLLAGVYIQGDDSVEYDGIITIDGRAPGSVRGPSEISWVPQATALLDHLTVKDNVTLPARMAGLDVKSYEERASRLIDALRIKDCKEKRPRQLSGGMRTRVSLGRALISQPKYLFLDEAFASLDLEHRWDIYELIAKERRERGKTTIMTTHNVPEAILLADRLIVLAKVHDRVSVDVQIKNNERIDFVGKPRAEMLKLARDRAQVIEDEVFGATSAKAASSDGA